MAVVDFRGLVFQSRPEDVVQVPYRNAMTSFLMHVFREGGHGIRGFGASELLVMTYAIRSNVDGAMTKTQAEIAEATGLGERTIRRAIHGLVESDFLRPVCCPGLGARRTDPRSCFAINRRFSVQELPAGLDADLMWHLDNVFGYDIVKAMSPSDVCVYLWVLLSTELGSNRVPTGGLPAIVGLDRRYTLRAVGRLTTAGLIYVETGDGWNRYVALQPEKMSHFDKKINDFVWPQ